MNDMPLDNKPERKSPQKTQLKGNKSRRILRTFVEIFLVTTLCLFAIVAGVALSFYRTIEPPEIPSLPVHRAEELAYSYPGNDESGLLGLLIGGGLTAPERFTADDRKDLFFTFLIIGLNEGTNANTIMVASYDGSSREINLISIPRDSLMNVNRRGRKISSAYMAGALGGRGRAGGVAQMQRDVMSVIGFIPDFYIVVCYDGFSAAIDAVGGIEIYVPFHKRYRDRRQNLYINIPPGLQHMNGETALHFARFRRSSRGFRAITDYQRIENQQMVVNAVIDSLLRPANILRIPEFVNIFSRSMYTNLTFGNLLWFANELNYIRGTDAISAYTMPTVGTSGEPMWYELLNGPAIVELVNRTINPYRKNILLRDINITHS